MAGSGCGGVPSCCVSELTLIHMRGSHIRMALCMPDPHGVTSALPTLWCVLQLSQPLGAPRCQAGRSPLPPGTHLSLLCPSSLPSATCQSWKCPEPAAIFCSLQTAFILLCAMQVNNAQITHNSNISVCVRGSQGIAPVSARANNSPCPTPRARPVEP